MKHIRYISAVIVLVVGFFILGIYIGLNKRSEMEKVVTIFGKEPQVETKADFSPFWKVWNTINKKYPNPDKASDQERVYGSIKGLVGSLNDPYTVFFDPEETKTFNEDITGNFSGVGMEVGIKDRVLTVISAIKDTPAYKAGIKSGDKIIKIDKMITTDLTIDKAIKLIRGEKGTAVTLTLLRSGSERPFEIKVVRDIINVPTLDKERRTDGIFVIKLNTFTGDSINSFRNAIKEFKSTKGDKLLLDLRGNPGGYLDAAVDIASWFLPDGKPVVIEDFGQDNKQKIYRSKGYNLFNDKLKFVILIDSGSASASEILAGAMQDYKRALLVGTQSYGKGSVQEILDVTSDTELKITVAKWYTPNGTSISEKGLTPDHKVELSDENIKNNKDTQMDKAIGLLNNWQGIK